MSQVNNQPSSLLDRIPPQSVQAERCVLGSMMLDAASVGEVVQLLKREHFVRESHQALYQALTDLYDNNGGKGIDLVTLRHHLDQKKLMDVIGGAAALAEIVESVPAPDHAVYYARIVRGKFLLRSLISTSTEILREAFDESEDPSQTLDRCEQRIYELAEAHSEGTSAVELSKLLHEVYASIENSDGSIVTGLATGFRELDAMTSGLQPGEMAIIAARPSMGKCLAADSEIVLADGSVATIEEICRRRQGRLLTLGQDWKLHHARPSAFVDDGIKPVYRVRTRLGRTVETTLVHPFLTIDGWKPVSELRPGQCVAVPRKIGVFGKGSMRGCEVKLAGYLIGDGSLGGASPRFTNTDPQLQADFIEAVEQFGGLVVSSDDSHGTRAPSFRVAKDAALVRQGRLEFSRQLKALIGESGRSSAALARQVGVSPAMVTYWTAGRCVPNEPTFNRLCRSLRVAPESLAPAGLKEISKNGRSRLTRWLDELGLNGKLAAGKTVPPVIFKLNRPRLALFLNRLFATDGWATVLATGQGQLGYASVSERLARQVQHLLLRFGVVAALKARRVKYKDHRRQAWQLDITDARSIQTFIDEIGIFGKEEALDRVRSALAQKRYQTNRDLIPVEVWRQIAQAKGDESWRSLGVRLGLGEGANMHVGRRAPTRQRLANLAAALDSAPLAALADSDVYWDRIVSIEPAGRKQVYDLTIPETHNFIANDICVHNTAFALNIAEHMAADNDPPIPVAFFSLEMAAPQLAQRLLASRAEVGGQKLRRRMLNDEEFGRLALHVGALSEAPLFIDDQPSLTVMQLRARARRLKTQRNIQAIFVDYLQLMDAPGGRDISRQQQISDISRGLKALARELKVPVIALSQLNRMAEGREGHRPRMSDLRESGSLEQDADLVMLLHREEYYHIGEADIPEEIRGVGEVIVAKQRNGPTGTVKLQFASEITRFRDLAQGVPMDEGAF